MNSPSRLTQRIGFRLAFLLAVSLLPLGVISTLQARALIKEARARSEAALLGTTRAAAAQEVSAIQRAQGAAEALSFVLGGLAADPAACSAMMQRLVQQSGLFSFAGYWTADGLMPCSSTGEPHALKLTDSARDAIANPVPAIRVAQDALFSQTSVLFARHPVFDSGGGLLGFATVSVPHSALLPESLDDEAETPVMLVTFNRDGTVITASVGLDHYVDALPANVDLADLVGQDARSFSGASRSGEERAFSVVPLIKDELYALGSWPAESLPTPISLTALPPSTVPLLMWLVSLTVALVAAERLVARHIRKLKIAFTSFASGNRAVTQLKLADAPDEIRKAGIAFEIMTEAILRDEAELEDMIHQKEVLLREVHHRVKNNLQLIASIMNMQARRARSPEAKVIVQRLQDRVMSLATIHKGLYQTTGIADVQADELLDDILRQIVNIGSAPHRRFDVSTDLERFRMTPDQAVPLALLVTEAITNAMKYGATENGGRIGLRSTLYKVEPLTAEIVVTNSICPGIPSEHEAATEGTGLGSQLVEAFATQLGGTLTREITDREYRLSVRFTVKPLAGGEARSAADDTADAASAAP